MDSSRRLCLWFRCSRAVSGSMRSTATAAGITSGICLDWRAFSVAVGGGRHGGSESGGRPLRPALQNKGTMYRAPTGKRSTIEVKANVDLYTDRFAVPLCLVFRDEFGLREQLGWLSAVVFRLLCERREQP